MPCVQDQIARLLQFQHDHPEVEFTVLGPGTCIKAEVPNKLPVVRVPACLGELLDEVEQQLDIRK